MLRFRVYFHKAPIVCGKPAFPYVLHGDEEGVNLKYPILYTRSEVIRLNVLSAIRKTAAALNWVAHFVSAGLFRSLFSVVPGEPLRVSAPLLRYDGIPGVLDRKGRLHKQSHQFEVDLPVESLVRRHESERDLAVAERL